ncbi:hypothetical protein LV716_04660 [Flagellimonas sp. HMM57]|uniref:hypothetical protein n=1 Tax=unclassified Flagellimonas TaxID=2644544 RepID=UPI0013D4138E|nr:MULTISPECIES: hypothetical protein [unclassified Flagellimonas]UII77086.1 hypothetical protein LV716_04660 [Flagellimonas sp. HMM57]
MSGHIIDMVNRIKQNKIPKRKKFQGDNRKLMYVRNTEATLFDFPKISEYELQKFKVEIKKKIKKDQAITLLLFIISFVIATILVVIFLKFYKLPN